MLPVGLGNLIYEEGFTESILFFYCTAKQALLLCQTLKRHSRSTMQLSDQAPNYRLSIQTQIIFC